MGRSVLATVLIAVAYPDVVSGEIELNVTHSTAKPTSTDRLRGSSARSQLMVGQISLAQPLGMRFLNNASSAVTLARACGEDNYTVKPGATLDVNITKLGTFWLVPEGLLLDCTTSNCSDCFYLAVTGTANSTTRASIGLGSLDIARKEDAANGLEAPSKSEDERAGQPTQYSNVSNASEAEELDSDDEAESDDRAEVVGGVVLKVPSSTARAATQRASGTLEVATCTRGYCDLQRFTDDGEGVTLIIQGDHWDGGASTADALGEMHKSDSGQAAAWDWDHDHDDHDHDRDRRRRSYDKDRRRRSYEFDRRRRSYDSDRRRSYDSDRRRSYRRRRSYDSDRRRRSYDSNRRRRSHDDCHHWHCSEHPHHHCWCH